MNLRRPTWCEINIDFLIENYGEIKRSLNGKKIMPVIKADAYGHDSIACGHALEKLHPHGFGVAFVEEAVKLRKAGIKSPLLILGYTPVEDVGRIIEWDLIPTVYDRGFAAALSKAADQPVKIHIKVDTGMGRLGFLWNEDFQDIEAIHNMENIEIEGIYSHFANADSGDKTFCRLQKKRFDHVLKQLEGRGVTAPIHHLANSAAVLDLEDCRYDLVRPGLILYGMYPSEEVNCSDVALKPIKQFKTTVAHVKTIEKGDSLSYGRTYIASERRRIATIPVGYADGYSRLLSHKAEVLIRGKRYPVRGTICMDQCMVDVTGSQEIAVGDEVTLYGEGLPIEEVAEWMNTINYEISCMITERVPKVFIYKGEVLSCVETLMERLNQESNEAME